MSIDDSAFQLPGMPLGVTPTYRRLTEAQGGQCAFVTNPRGKNQKATQCSRTLTGGHRLYQWEETLLCGAHFDKARREARKATT
jgi:hypothetical protein